MSTHGTTRTRFWLTPDGAVALLVAVCILGASYVQNVNLLLLLFAIIVSLTFTAAIFCRRNMRDVTVLRHLPLEAFAGTEVFIQVEVVGPTGKRTRWGIAVEDRVETSGSTDPGSEAVHRIPRRLTRVYFPSVLSGCSRRQHYRFLPRHRGQFHFRRLTVSSRFPLGVFESRRIQDDDETLIVFPRIGKLHDAWRQRMRGQHSLFASRSPDSGVNDFEFHSLREFRTGDSLRHIHWRTTARRGELMLKEFEPLETRDVLLILDPWLEENPPPEHREQFEKLISFVASCCVELCRWPGNRLVLLIAGQQPQVLDRQTSARAAEEMLSTLALLQPDPAATFSIVFDSIPFQKNSHLMVCIAGMRSLNEWEAPLRQALGGSVSRNDTFQFIDASSGDLEPLITIDSLPEADDAEED